MGLAEDSRVRPLGGGRYQGAIPAEWYGGAGPHGGYVAALVLRAMTDAVADPGRPAGSLTMH